MTHATSPSATAAPQERDLSLLTVGIVLLRWRRTIIRFVSGGAILGLAVALLSPAKFRSTATFLPQGSQTGASGLALAASQLGLPVPSTGGFWVSGIFVSLLKSRTLLGPLALDTFTVAGVKGGPKSLMDLLRVTAGTPELRLEKTIVLLQRKVVTASDDRRLGTVSLVVETGWRDLSLALAERLVRGVNDFNLQTRKSQASAERQFVETRVGETEKSLRAAENALQEFLLRNRVIASPALAFERDRLQRVVALQQQMYSTLVLNREDAKIREVRDTPVITVTEAPQAAARRVPRGVVRKVALGMIVGLALSMLVLLVRQSARAASEKASNEGDELAILWADFRQGVPFLGRK
jgi:uncharacterized protein involved in exopolysaccharide biosynthesis